MASIVQRNNRYNVVYLYDDEVIGKRKQKWESYKTMSDAKRRKAEIEYRQELGTMVIVSMVIYSFHPFFSLNAQNLFRIKFKGTLISKLITGAKILGIPK